MIESERARRWASTMEGHATVPDIRLAHAGPGVPTGAVAPLARAEREAAESVLLVSGATRAAGAGNRARPEEPDPLRTCFERDRDRILHSTAFRRLAGKTQVFVFPDDHQRTRLTHALEVAQVATAVARATRLNVALTEAIALGHDCGHGPGGHASEEALSPYLDGGYDHAVWGADVVLDPLNLCTETLDGIRNHSWSRPAPSTPEGAVVSWADRCAYTAHDLEDAVRAGVVSLSMLPPGRRRTVRLHPVPPAPGVHRRPRGGHHEHRAGGDAGRSGRGPGRPPGVQLRAHLPPPGLGGPGRLGRVGAPGARRSLRRPAQHPAPSATGGAVRPGGLAAGSPEALRAAVTYVAGMTDRFAFQSAVAHLGWDPGRLPVGIDTASLRRTPAS